MISVRLSEDEYVALQRLCIVTGARSVSDLTRDAMQSLLNQVDREDAIGEFRSQMTCLVRKVEELSERMSSVQAAQET
jgi:metal-responsive CopG/Arc/MetJ family transcriptional regulator